MADVFISYASSDRDRVEPLVDQLESSGFSVWWDSHLRGGSMFGAEIQSELEMAKVVLCVWTTPSLTSHWVADEAEFALRTDKLIPIKLDDIEAPIGFRQVQTIDFTAWNGLISDSAMQTLTAAITHHTGPRDLPRDEAATASVEAAPLEFSPPNKPSIAILPFRSLGSDPDQDFLADGIRFGIQATLVQLSGLFLVNAAALNSYRDRKVTASSAGNELGVRYILEGAVQQAGDRIRATVQLTDVNAKQTVWAESYDRVVEDVFNLQDEITHEVVSALNVKLQHNEMVRVWFNKLSNPKAREYYYRGSSYLYEGNKGDNASAREMFEKLHHVQPDTVTGPSNISLTHWLDWFMGWSDDPVNSMDQAAEWAKKAMEYDDNNGIGHAICGHMKLLEGEYDEARDICSLGVRLRSSCPLAHGLLGLVQIYSGDAGSAVKSAREALNLEKTYPTWLINILAVAYRDAGKFDLSIPTAKESVRLDPLPNDAKIILCSDYNLASDHKNARAMADEIVANDPSFSLSDFGARQPYKDSAQLDRLLTSLRQAGLPD